MKKYVIFTLVLFSVFCHAAFFGTAGTSPYTSQGISCNIHLDGTSLVPPLSVVVISSQTSQRFGYGAVGWNISGGANRLLNFYLNQSNDYWELEWGTNGNGGGGYYTDQSASGLQANYYNGKIHVLVITVNVVVSGAPHNSLNFTIDGVFPSGFTDGFDSGTSSSFKTSSTAPFQLMEYDPTGASAGGITGTVYECAMYNRILSVLEVQEMVSRKSARFNLYGRVFFSEFKHAPAGTTVNSLVVPSDGGVYNVEYVNSPRIDGNINSGKTHKIN